MHNQRYWQSVTTVRGEEVESPDLLDGMPDIKGEDVRDWRKNWHLKQSDLALMLGVNVNTVSRWETGRHEIEYPRMVMLSIFFYDTAFRKQIRDGK